MLQRVGTFLAGLLTGLLAAGLVWLLIAEPRGTPVVLNPPPTTGPIRVHVTGEVHSPGVYSLPVGSIVQAALDAAGGPTSDAALTFVNLAAGLTDGDQVLVPKRADEEGGVALDSEPLSARETVTPAVGRVNVNLASAPELELLPGIGPSLAQKIIDYRQANGPFQDVEDLMEVSGIGPAKLEALLDWIRVD